MRVLFVIRSLDLGGAERQCCGLATSLRNRGHDVCVVSLASGGALTAELGRHDVQQQSCGHRGPRDVLRSGFRLRKIANEFSPDVIYSFMSVSNVLCALFLPRTSRRFLLWGVRASWVGHPGYGHLTRLVLRIEGWLAHVPRLIISNSRAGADHHIQLGYPPDHMRVVENSIDSSTFNYTAANRDEVRKELGIDAAKRIVVVVARLDVIKGHETFLAAAAGVLAQRNDVDFWCIGGGNPELAASLKRRARDLHIESHMHWHGEVRETATLARLLCAFDLAVSASMAEGFPNTVAESLACGLQVVGTDAGDTKRMIGRSGECVPIGDAEAMTSAILRLLDYEVPRERVRNDFLSRFSPELLMDRHESTLLEITEDGRVRGQVPR